MKNKELLALLTDYLNQKQSIANKSPLQFREELLHKAIELYLQQLNSSYDMHTINTYMKLIKKQLIGFGYFLNGEDHPKAQKLASEKSTWAIEFEIIDNGILKIFYKKKETTLLEYIAIIGLWETLKTVYESTNELISVESKFRAGKKLTKDQRVRYRKIIGLCLALPNIKSEIKFCESVGLEDSKAFNKWKNDQPPMEIEEIKNSFSKEELEELKRKYLSSL